MILNPFDFSSYKILNSLEKYNKNYKFIKISKFFDMLYEKIEYLNSDYINSEEIKNKINSLLPCLRHFYKTSTCRSITLNGKSKNEISNLLRQILKTLDYKLKSKTFCTKINGKVTTRTKYYISNNEVDE